jgi:hypothetical protein
MFAAPFGEAECFLGRYYSGLYNCFGGESGQEIRALLAFGVFFWVFIHASRGFPLPSTFTH